jgi:hypothetical protein
MCDRARYRTCDDKVDRLSDRDPATAQETVSRRSLGSQFRIDERYDFEFPQCGLDAPRLRIGAQTLLDLTEDQISNRQFLRRNQ